jgi:eukaryotic-like serine/threonine-protein kinase
MPLVAGTRLGPYEIVAPIGEGGMGEVYRARDTKLNRDVAIKVLPDLFANDSDRLARFQREAQVLASLNHPNIAHIHGLEDSDGVHALVMELVEGEDLAQRLCRGAIALDEALPIARQVAEALEAAHEHGIIHRDLKPANIKLRPDGTVKVLDFGLAKALEGSGAPGGLVSQSPTITTPAMMTGVGVILGTAAYMSPEQARGKVIDRRADIWAYGCVLFEMLTGQRTFEGELMSDVLASVLKTDPNWQAMPAGTPAALRRLVGRCLEKDPRRRLQAIGEARVQIDDLLTGAPEPIAGPTVSLSAPLWPWLALAGVSAVVIGAAVAVTGSWLARPAAPRVTRTNLAATGPAALTINGNDRDLAISPDGSRVVYVGNNGTQLFVRSLDALEPVVIATGQIREPFVSPDGQSVGFVEGLNTLKKVAISGGPSIQLTTLDGAPQGATWLPDDTIVFATNNPSTGLQRVSANGGTPAVVTRPDHQRDEVDHLWPEILPGGRVLLFTITAQTGGPDNASIAALDLRTQTSTILVRGGLDAHYAESGHLVYVAAGTLRAVPFDLKTLAVRGSAVPVVPRLVTTRSGAGEFGVARDGTLVYVDVTVGSRSARTRTLVWVDRTGKEERIAAPTRSYEAPRISPDGKQLALAITDQEGDIWVWDLVRGGDLRQLTFDPGVDTFPVWTPDSHRIVFSSQSGGALNLWWKAVNETGSAQQLTTSANNQWPTSISSDGKQVVLTELTPTTGRDLMRLTLDGSQRVTPLLQTPFDEQRGAISPDGHWLAYESNRSGQSEIWVRPFPNTSVAEYLISTSGGTRPAWALSGKELFFLGADGALMGAPVEATPTTWNSLAPKKLLEPRYYTGGGNPNRSYDVSPDGQRFLMIKAASADPTAVPPNIIVVQHFDEELKRLVPTK